MLAIVTDPVMCSQSRKTYFWYHSYIYYVRIHKNLQKFKKLPTHRSRKHTKHTTLVPRRLQPHHLLDSGRDGNNFVTHTHTQTTQLLSVRKIQSANWSQLFVLLWLNSNASSSPRLIWWAEPFQPCNSEIVQRKGSLHKNADILSRIPGVNFYVYVHNKCKCDVINKSS